MFRRQTDEVFSTLQQVQRRLSQHTDGSAPEDVVSPTIRRVSNPNDGRRAPPPSTAAPRSATKGARKGSQYGGKFQVNEGSAEQPAHVVPVIDRSNMGNTGKVLGEQGIAEEYAPLPASPMARQPGILIRPLPPSYYRCYFWVQWLGLTASVVYRRCHRHRFQRRSVRRVGALAIAASKIFNSKRL